MKDDGFYSIEVEGYCLSRNGIWIHARSVVRRPPAAEHASSIRRIRMGPVSMGVITVSSVESIKEDACRARNHAFW